MKNIRRIVWSSLLLTVISGAPMAVAADSDKPNFLSVLADDVSWTDFSFMNTGLPARTPNIDKLASQGMRFNNCFCGSSVCTPVRHELYTGLLLVTSGIFDKGQKPKGKYPNIVNFLRDEGCAVGLAGKTDFPTSIKFPTVHGFTGNANDDVPTWSMEGAEAFIEEARADSKPFLLVLASVHGHRW